MGYTSFEDFRTVTSWVRPARGHGCKPVEILPGPVSYTHLTLPTKA